MASLILLLFKRSIVQLLLILLPVRSFTGSSPSSEQNHHLWVNTNAQLIHPFFFHRQHRQHAVLAGSEYCFLSRFARKHRLLTGVCGYWWMVRPEWADGNPIATRFSFYAL